MKKRLLESAVLLAVITLFPACGGGGGGGGGGGDTTAPTLNITSHSEGQVITGSRAITVQWSASDDVGVTSSQLTLNGTQATVTGSNENYSASITLANGTNTIGIQASDAASNTTSVTLDLTYPFLAATNGQAASVVIGQANFTSGDSNQGGSADANTINSPYGNALVYSGVLYLPDWGNNRILGFNSVPAGDNASADFVIGQPGFITTTAGTAAGMLSNPQTVVVSDGKMFAVEYDNNRVLIWNSVPTSTGVAADVVVGQSDFGLGASGCAQNQLDSPESIHVVNGKLIVGDSVNNRVLIWNSIPTTPGQAADLVLGQGNFTSCDPDRGGLVAADTLNYPAGIWSDGTRLIVADADNNRVLIWNDLGAIVSGQAADVVLGQPDMLSSGFAASDKDLNYPYLLHSNGNQLFVADSDNNRVLIWDSIPTANYAPADRVLGQADFDGFGFGTSATQLNYPTGVFAFDNKLIVTDNANNRYLVFEVP